MRLSMNETRMLCQRAAVGAGLPYGLAEECAGAAVWLAAIGLPGVEVFRRAVSGSVAGRTSAVGPERVGGDRRLGPTSSACAASALFAGPALGDHLRAQAAAEQLDVSALRVLRVDEPLLAAACVLCDPERLPDRLLLSWQAPGSAAWLEARIVNGAISIWAPPGMQPARPGPVDVLAAMPGRAADDLECLRTAADIERGAKQCSEKGVVVAQEAYEALGLLARRTLVADSEQSRLAGAGAGLVDND